MEEGWQRSLRSEGIPAERRQVRMHTWPRNRPTVLGPYVRWRVVCSGPYDEVFEIRHEACRFRIAVSPDHRPGRFPVSRFCRLGLSIRAALLAAWKCPIGPPAVVRLGPWPDATLLAPGDGKFQTVIRKDAVIPNCFRTLLQSEDQEEGLSQNSRAGRGGPVTRSCIRTE